jgi:hypothetical protein
LPLFFTWGTIENVVVSRDSSRSQGSELDLVAKMAKCAGQSAGSFADGVRVGTVAALFISDTLMQDLAGDPDKADGRQPRLL